MLGVAKLLQNARDNAFSIGGKLKGSCDVSEQKGINKNSVDTQRAEKTNLRPQHEEMPCDVN
jgi:hypothetical protein